MILFPGVLIW